MKLRRVGEHVGELRPLHTPEAVAVVTRRGSPSFVAGVRVLRVLDRWRVEDGWWRACPTARMYWTVELDGHRIATVYQDLLGRGWYRQPYPQPQEAPGSGYRQQRPKAERGRKPGIG